MSLLLKKNLNQLDDQKVPEKVKSKTVNINGFKVQRVTVEPGWRWSEHTKPIVGGDSCQKHHLLYVLSGKLHVKMNDGKEEEFSEGDIADIPSGHDGWNAGNEDLTWLDIQK